MYPAIAELGGTAILPDFNGRSLVPLLHGQIGGDWRTVALVQDRGPVRNVVEPDLSGIRSGNPTTGDLTHWRTAGHGSPENGTLTPGTAAPPSTPPHTLQSCERRLAGAFELGSYARAWSTC